MSKFDFAKAMQRPVPDADEEILIATAGQALGEKILQYLEAWQAGRPYQGVAVMQDFNAGELRMVVPKNFDVLHAIEAWATASKATYGDVERMAKYVKQVLPQDVKQFGIRVEANLQGDEVPSVDMGFELSRISTIEFVLGRDPAGVRPGCDCRVCTSRRRAERAKEWLVKNWPWLWPIVRGVLRWFRKG